MRAPLRRSIAPGTGDRPALVAHYYTAHPVIPSADDPHGITTCTITFNSTTAQDKSAARALPDSDARGDDNE
jgi:hypothetical protein